MVARERHLLSGDGLLAVAVIENNLGSTLDQQHLRAAGRLVERRHELVLRIRTEWRQHAGERFVQLADPFRA